jgi:hypothetical protein
MRRLLLLLGFALLASACAAGTSDTTTTADFTATSGATQSTAPSTAPSTAAEGSASQPPSTTGAVEKPPPEGRAAPDFTTVLASGETFTLSQAVKPVYMVFWAEW